jgi:hypothetical protein
MDLTPIQIQAIAGWAEKTPGIAEVRLFGTGVTENPRPVRPVSLAVSKGGVGIGDPFTHYFAGHERWSAELTKLVGLPTGVYWHDPRGAPKVHALCQEASLLIYSRKA